MNILIHSHSGLRWVALILIIAAIVNAGLKLKNSKYTKKDRLLNLFAMITLHIQLLIGLVLYFLSGKVNLEVGFMANNVFRFFVLEHFLGMLIAIIVITLGRRKAEKNVMIEKKHKAILVWYTIGLVLILAFIPWPFRNLGITGWF